MRSFAIFQVDGHALAKQVGKDLANLVHVGSTTQDILDTGLVLQIKEALDLVEQDLKPVVAALVELAETHKHTVMAGRTNSLQAAPITFGLKVAGWLSEVTRAVERLRNARERVLAVQLGGAVGTFDEMGPKGIEARASMARILQLRSYSVGWTTQRDNIAECLVTQMKANLDLDGGAVISAAYAKALSKPLGRTAAFDLVKAAAARARKERRSLAEVIAEAPELGGKMAPDELKRLLNPADHVGLAPQLVDLAIKDAQRLWKS